MGGIRIPLELGNYGRFEVNECLSGMEMWVCWVLYVKVSVRVRGENGGVF